jgi:hypothetical protein
MSEVGGRRHTTVREDFRVSSQPDLRTSLRRINPRISPAKSHPPAPAVAMAAVGELAVEGGEQDAYRLSASLEPALTFKALLQAHAPSTVNNVPGTDTNEPVIDRSGLNS